MRYIALQNFSYLFVLSESSKAIPCFTDLPLISQGYDLNFRVQSRDALGLAGS